jgi:PilZ domain
MTADMAFEGLVVSHDAAVLGVVSRLLHDLSICTYICLSSSKASDQLPKCGPDLVVIDWKGPSSSELVSNIWSAGDRKKPIIVAISAIRSRLTGVHIVLPKPVTIESAEKSLRSAYSMMLQEHRRNVRYALMLPVKTADPANRRVCATILDIGEGGIGISCNQKLVIGDLLSFRLWLPGSKRDIYVQVRVLWTKDYGRAGCEFARIPPVDCEILHDWLSCKLEIKKPLITV